MKENKKAQMTPVAVMVFVVALVIVFIMLPIIMGIVDTTLQGAVTNSTNPNGALIMVLADLVPVVFVLAVLMSILSTAIPRQPGYA
jgi:Na+/proline symporter